MVTLQAPPPEPNVADVAFPIPRSASVNEIQSLPPSSSLSLVLQHTLAFFYLPARSPLLHQQLNPRIHANNSLSGVCVCVCVHANETMYLLFMSSIYSKLKWNKAEYLHVPAVCQCLVPLSPSAHVVSYVCLQVYLFKWLCRDNILQHAHVWGPTLHLWTKTWSPRRPQLRFRLNNLFSIRILQLICQKSSNVLVLYWQGLTVEWSSEAYYILFWITFYVNRFYNIF